MKKTQGRVLAIGAHPDDIEEFAGGTLLLLKEAGYKLTIAVLTDGACGSKTLPAAEIVKVRRREAQRGAQILGADYINLGIGDGCVEYNLQTAQKLVALIRDIKPDIIFTHPTADYMTDHAHTGQLVLWAVPESRHANFTTSPTSSPLNHHPFVYHTDPQGLVGSDGQIAPVNRIVDISDVIEQKLTALDAHKSQVRFVNHGSNLNMIEKARRWAITRGEQVEIKYAEGFVQQLLAGYPRHNILKDILGDKVYAL